MGPVLSRKPDRGGAAKGVEPDAPRRDEREQVREWRREQLAQMGFGAEDARELADSPHVDLHAARALLNGGASHAQTRAILD